ncbi:hypothetical protein [uncultured Bacteroides sp.]|uniref:hypothetical protein n=1 Tax=uncultured Bacteroides sp. TaxID=162156 RepID=UPI0026313FD9|nr:hypothetical protein [uncultured Bacteroides sp.]
MEKIDYCKDDLYELIHRLITREINEIDFSDEYYIAFIYNSNYWNSSEELRGSELLLFNQLAEVSNYLVSFAEVKLSSDETSILKEKLRNTAIQISKKMCIYNLLEQYLHDKISTTDFCNKFYDGMISALIKVKWNKTRKYGLMN